MTLRTALWLAGVPWLAWGAFGCEPINARECTTDQGCSSYERCDTALGACVLRECTSDDQCGVDGQCDGGSGTYCVAAGPCVPACPSYEGCAHGTCAGRYRGITILEPTDGGTVGSPATVRAFLEVDPRFARQDPASLQLSTTPATGTIALLPETGGNYSGAWSPIADRMYELIVAYPDAGIQSAGVNVHADLNPPVLTIIVPPPSRRADDAGWAHDGDDQLPNAWRRDESAIVQVTADEQVDAGSVKLMLFGIGDAGLPGPLATTVTLNPSTSCGGNPNCYEGSFDLAQPMMRAGRGKMELVATASDLIGHEGVADGGIDVTRVRWVFSASSSDSIKTAPAIGRTGRVYFGTASGSGTAGALWAVEASGELKWTVDAGAVEASPAVGYGVDGGVETVYAAFNVSTNTVLAAFAPGEIESYRCELTGKAEVAIAIGATRYIEPVAVESAFILLRDGSGGKLIALRPGGEIGFKCMPVISTGLGAFPSGVAVTGTKVFFGDESGLARGYEFTPATGWSVLPGWPVSVGTSVSSVMLSPVAVLGTAGVTNQGGAFSIPLAGGGLDWTYPSTFPVGDQAYPAAWSDGGFVFPTKEALGGAKSLVRAQPPADAGESIELSSFVQSAPVVAADGMLYLAGAVGTGTQGRVESFHSDLKPDWTLDLTGEVLASPNMDCRRDGSGARQHGHATLYVVTKSGRLYSIITDSDGIDTTAPWPRYQHDPRSTGNADVRLSDFACP